ncbi:MAG: putative Ig domain-containing protein [Candidatus Magnetomorum sp.]|nr:putative Ig domain-containing protein [Candidatus Magnetomorum sp.]
MKNLLLRMFVIACVLTCAFTTQATMENTHTKAITTGSMSGVVTSCGTGNPIENVQVCIDTGNGEECDTTDYNGYYCIDDLFPVPYVVMFRYANEEKTLGPVMAGTLNTCLCPASEIFYVKTESLKIAVQGKEYWNPIEISGGCPPLIFSYTGFLPDGLQLDSNTGVISGTPIIAESNVGSFDFKVIVTDSKGNAPYKYFTIDVVKPLSFKTGRIKSAMIDQPFFFQIVVTGGLRPFLFSHIGIFPDGLELDTNGYLSGIPEQVATTSCLVSVSDSSGQTLSNMFPLKVVETLKIVTETLSDGIVDKVYNMQISAEGGYGQIFWGIHSILPQLLTIDKESGVFSGLLKEALRKKVTFTVMDEDNHMAYKTFWFTASHSLQIINTAFPPALVDEDYFEYVDNLGGIPPFIYSFTGELPSGISFDQENGIFRGTPKGTEQNVPVYVTIEDSSQIFMDENDPVTHQKDRERINITVVDTLTITTPSKLPPVPVDLTLTEDILFKANAGDPPYHWELIKGTVPYGTYFTRLNENNAAIIGRPEESGDFIFSLKVTDNNGETAEKSFYWTIFDKLDIITTHIPDIFVGNPVSIELKAKGGLPPYAWTVSDNLPEGLTFYPQTNTIEGIPLTLSTQEISLSVRDSYTVCIQEDVQSVILNINGDTLAIITSELPDTLIDRSYKAQIMAISDSPPLIWSRTEGVLPPGLTMETYLNTVYISGRSDTPGIYPVTFKVTDSGEPSEKRSKDYTIRVYDGIRIVSSQLDNAVKGDDYSGVILAEGPEPPHVFKLTSGKLPSGLTLNRETGEISGTVLDTAETSSFTIKVTKSGTFGSEDEQEFVLYISGSPFAITTSFIPNLFCEFEMGFPLKAAGGLKSYHWFLAGGYLPDGLTIEQESNDYIISGTPIQGGDFYIFVKANDSAFNTQYSSRGYKFSVTCNGNDDTSPPQKPVFEKSFPNIKITSNGIIRVCITQPEDDNDVSGYSYIWNTSETHFPDNTPETNQTEIISPQLETGNNHYLHVRAVDTSKNASEPLSIGPFYVERPSNAIMLVGCGEQDLESPYWLVTKKLTQSAYQDFFDMGYGHHQIDYYINAQAIDFDGDTIPDDIVDESFSNTDTTSASAILLTAISSKTGVDTHHPLYLYIHGHATSEGQLIIKGNDTISDSDLDDAFTSLQNRTGCQIILILESTFSGKFLSTLSDYGRIIITSAGNNRYNTDANARVVFSRYFFSKLKARKSIYDAFVFARDVMRNIGYPEPLLDDTADGIANASDGNMAKTLDPCLNNSWADQPEIHSVSLLPVLGNPQRVNLTVENLTGDLPIDDISVSIISSDMYGENDSDTVEFREVVMSNASGNAFSETIDDLTTDAAYRFLFHSRNRFDEPSDPQTGVINQAIPLNAGWNLMSFSVNKVFYEKDHQPLISTLSNAEWIQLDNLKDALQSIDGKYEIIRNFDVNGAAAYNPALPSFINSLHYLAAGYGYWIKMKESATWVIPGLLIDPSEPLTLRTGWNLVGCWHTHMQYELTPPSIPLPQQPTGSLKDVFQSINGNYLIVRSHDQDGAKTFNPALPSSMNTLHYISPGFGYWIKMVQPQALTY